MALIRYRNSIEFFMLNLGLLNALLSVVAKNLDEEYDGEVMVETIDRIGFPG